MKKHIYVTISILLFLCCSEMETKWTGKFDAAGTGNYRINSIYSSKTGTYVTGTHWTTDKGPFCITAKYDPNGELEWHKIYEQQYLKAAQGKSILVAKEHALDTIPDIYVLCQANDIYGIRKVVLIKYDSLGNIQWDKVIEESTGKITSKILLDYQGNIYIAGWSTNPRDSINIFIAKYEPSGELAWFTKYYNPSLVFSDLKFDIRKGDQILIGGALEKTQDFFFMRYGSLGNFLSLTKYESPEQENILADIKMGVDGSVYLTGTSFSNESNNDYLTVAYDKDNNLLWAKRFDSVRLDDVARAITVDESSNVYVTGSSENEQGNTSILTIKYDREGNELWTNTFKGKKNESVEPYILYPGFLYYGRKTVVRTFFITGTAGHDVLILKHNTNGFYSWSTRYKDKGRICKPTAFSKDCVAIESTLQGKSEAVIVKYDKAEQFGIARWD